MTDKFKIVVRVPWWAVVTGAAKRWLRGRKERRAALAEKRRARFLGSVAGKTRWGKDGDVSITHVWDLYEDGFGKRTAVFKAAHDLAGNEHSHPHYIIVGDWLAGRRNLAVGEHGTLWFTGVIRAAA